MNGGTAVDAGGDVAAGGRPFGRLAIVNRGEPAMRLINAVREWNAEGRPPLRTIALYTAADRRAMFVREADEAVLIGPDTDGGAGAPNPYLDLPELARALRACRAEAVWPGWGFVSERAEFAQLCRDLGIVFVGPSPEVMRALGDKIESKLLAAQVGVPMAEWSGGPVADLAEARAHAEEIGYPLMVKATAGGGGRGIRLVSRPEELDEAFTRAAAEGARTAGDGTVFLERALRGGRHVEVQVVADAAGDVWTLGVRDCTVQRRNQKVLEESASVALDAEQVELLCTSAAQLARAAGYVNAGTVEFLYEPGDRQLSFLEVNTRLQVEHPVTEATTGVDVVKLQLHVAMGGRLADLAPAAPPAHGHAIEARLTAEDPEHGFAPAPGVIEHLVLPGGPGVRVDTGVAAGDAIPPQFDSMIAKVIAWGRDRDEARGRLARALRQTSVVIDGGTTNKAFLLDLLDRPQVRTGEVDTGWLDRLMAEGYRPPHRLDVALLAVAVEAQDEHAARQREQLFASAERGRPEVGHETWHQIDVRAGGEAYRLRVAQTRGNRYRVELDGVPVDVSAERIGRFERRLTIAGTTYAVLVAPQGADHLVEVDGAVHRISGGEAGLVRAPAPAMVVAIPVAAGDTVAAGDPVAVVESMKLETALRAPFAGRVREVLVAVNTQVEGGTTLLRLEPAGDAAQAEEDVEDRVGLAGLAATSTEAAATRTSPSAAAADALDALRSLVLGYDVDEAAARELPRALSAARADLPDDDPQVLAGELAIMQIFADLSALSRNRRGPEVEEAQPDGIPEADSAERAHNPQEYLHAFLRSRDADAEGLPEPFRARLRAALAHYGVRDLGDPDDQALAGALYRMFLAHRRARAHVPVVLDLLQWRLAHAAGLTTLPPEIREEYLRTLEHLITATQVRHPVVGDLARRVLFRGFDEPLLAAARARGQQEVRAELDRLAATTDPATRAAIVDDIVAAAEPILTVFGEPHLAAMLEVMTRRYYRIRHLTDVTVVDRGGRPLLSATYRHDGRDHIVLATTVHTAPAAPVAGEPPAVQADLRRIVARLPADCTVLLDLYVTAGQAPDDDPERSAEKIRESLGTLPAPLDRVAIAVRRAGSDERSSWFTFHPAVNTAGLTPRGEPGARRGPHPARAAPDGGRAAGAVAADELHADPPAVADRRPPVPRGGPQRARRPAARRALRRTRPVGRPRLPRPGARPAPARARPRRLPGRPARGPGRRPRRRAVGLEPRAALRLAGGGPAARRVRQRRQPAGAAHRGAGAGADPRAVPARAPVGRGGRDGADGAAPARVPAPGAGLTVRITKPPRGPLRELDAYTQKVIRARRRGAVYPYELLPMLERNPDPGGEPGTFTEYDLDDTGAPVPVQRPPGSNTANIVLGTVSTPTARYPEGMRRVVLIGDPTRALGAIAAPECRRVLAALELARELSAPVEWFAVSAGAKIAMDSGTENMDWISRVLRGLIEFTQEGRRDQRGRDGDQRRGTALLERRVDDAHAHQGHPGDDPGLGDGAHRQAVARLLRRRVGRRQLRHRRLRPDHGPERAGAVLGAGRVGGGGRPAGPLRAHLPGTRRALPAARADVGPGRTATSATPRTPAASSPASGRSSITRRTRSARSRSTSARCCAPSRTPTTRRWSAGWTCWTRRTSWSTTRTSAGSPSRCWASSRSHCPAGARHRWTGRRPSPRGRCSRSRRRRRRGRSTPRAGTGPWSCWRTCRGSTARRSRCVQQQLEYGAEIGRSVVNFDGPIVFCVVSRYHGGAFVVFSRR